MFNEFEQSIIDNPPTIKQAAGWALAEMNELAQNGQLPTPLENVRTRLSVAFSLEDGRLIGGSLNDVKLAEYVTGISIPSR